VDVEEIYADLDRIARGLGELDEAAVSDATAILSLPRYQAVSNPAGLLVEDLQCVIEATPNYPPQQGATAEEHGSHNLRNYARRYFSLDEPGTNFTHRRAFGRKTELGGSLGTWMNRGVLWRMAAGLLAIQFEQLQAEADLEPPSYKVQALTIERDIRTIAVEPNPVFQLLRRSRRFHALYERFRICSIPYKESLTYEVQILEERPHILPLPLPPRHLKLWPTDNRRDCLTSRATPNGHRVPRLAFGEQLRAGVSASFTVVHSPWVARGCSSFLRLDYIVDQPIETLTLEFEVRKPARYTWTAWHLWCGPEDEINEFSETDAPDVPKKTFDAPPVGSHCTLYAHQKHGQKK
jgi:hypothetical protein